MASTSTSATRQVHTVNNTELYDRWASVYDTDGNILQAVDDLLLPPLLTHALEGLASSAPVTVTELGCGTGRNTLKLLASPIPIEEVIALDLSPGMLEVARTRCTTAAKTLSSPPTLRFAVFDASDASQHPDISQLQGKANLVLSTLVLEHLPLAIFFAAAALLLQPAGVLVLTNMHADMGRRSQAGFVDPETGAKVRGDSFVYEVEDVLRVGGEYGFEVLGEVVERGVREEDVGEGRLLGPRGRKWIGHEVWFGVVMRYDRR